MNYFKYFNEVNKLDKYIKYENGQINYEDLILDFIYEKRDLKLENIMRPSVSRREASLKH